MCRSSLRKSCAPNVSQQQVKDPQSGAFWHADLSPLLYFVIQFPFHGCAFLFIIFPMIFEALQDIVCFFFFLLFTFYFLFFFPSCPFFVVSGSRSSVICSLTYVFNFCKNFSDIIVCSSSLKYDVFSWSHSANTAHFM